MASEWATAIPGPAMSNKGRIRRFDIWIVTNGTSDKHITLTAGQAQAFAKIYNQHVFDPSRRVRVERKRATVE